MEKEHLILVILGSILVFLLIREFLCWYWKINAALSRLDRIAGRLDDIFARLPPPEASEPVANAGAGE